MMKSLRRAIWLLYFVFLVFFTLLALSSYFAYSTAGFDFEEPTEKGVDVTYYRLRWDDGSTFAGMAIQPVPRPNRPLDWFDPGGVLLDEPTKPRHPHWINDWGFWWITSPAEDPFVFDRYGGATTSYWCGAPSWLLLLLAWIPAFFCFWRLIAWTTQTRTPKREATASEIRLREDKRHADKGREPL